MFASASALPAAHVMPMLSGGRASGARPFVGREEQAMTGALRSRKLLANQGR
jgi:hypothetical protein